MKKICILGSTGSIGTQTLDVCRKYPEQFQIVALSAKSNIYLLSKQIFEFKPKRVCLYDSTKVDELKELLEDLDYDVKIHTGEDGLIRLVNMKKTDIIVNALVGFVGFKPTLQAIENKKTIALANKESLVVGGAYIMKSAKENKVDIIPIDSEHSAIFQSMLGNNKKDIKKIILTASGGPFFGKTTADLEKVSLEEALKHPNWDMGSKVTIDSATLMNKGLELIEACWLFDVAPENIEIVVHRESIVHSLVEYADNSVIAQLSVPDMKIPIQYALTHPNRYETDTKPLSLVDCASLSFDKPDPDTFLCLKACIEAIKRGGTYPAIVNAANEESVNLYLQGKIEFVDIGRIVYGSLDLGFEKRNIKIEDILVADKIGRGYANGFIKAKKNDENPYVFGENDLNPYLKVKDDSEHFAKGEDEGKLFNKGTDTKVDDVNKDENAMKSFQKQKKEKKNKRIKNKEKNREKDQNQNQDQEKDQDQNNNNDVENEDNTNEKVVGIDRYFTE